MKVKVGDVKERFVDQVSFEPGLEEQRNDER